MPCDHEAVLEALARDSSQPPSEARIAALDATVAGFGSSEQPGAKTVIARALHDKMRLLFQLQRPDEADSVGDELRTRFAAAEPEARRWACLALFGAAHTRKGARRRALIDDYATILEVASARPSLDDLSAEALYLMGKCGSFLAPDDPVCVRANEALRRLGDRYLPSDEPRVASFVAAGFLMRARRCWPESEEARALYRRVVDRYGDASGEIQEHAVEALSDWGERLMRRAPEQALEVWDESWARFRHLRTPTAQAALVRDRLNRAVVLGQLAGAVAELSAYAEMVETFWDSPWPAVQRWVVAAAENRAMTLRDAGQAEEARRVLERALARFGPATEPPQLVQAVAKASRLLASLR